MLYTFLLTRVAGGIMLVFVTEPNENKMMPFFLDVSTIFCHSFNEPIFNGLKIIVSANN